MKFGIILSEGDWVRVADDTYMIELHERREEFIGKVGQIEDTEVRGDRGVVTLWFPWSLVHGRPIFRAGDVQKLTEAEAAEYERALRKVMDSLATMSARNRREN
jgi:hypothetical protein